MLRKSQPHFYVKKIEAEPKKWFSYLKKRVHYLFSIYVPLKILLRCVWCFDFACFNMTVVKNPMKKYPFMMYFQNAYAILVLHNFFVRETLSRKMMVLY